MDLNNLYEFFRLNRRLLPNSLFARRLLLVANDQSVNHLDRRNSIINFIVKNWQIAQITYRYMQKRVRSHAHHDAELLGLS